MFEADTIEEVLQELLEVTEATEITEDGQQVSFESIQDLYKERVYNLCDLLGMENLYLGDSVKQSAIFKKKDEFIESRITQLDDLPKEYLSQYIAHLELAFNRFVHTEEDLYDEVCNSYYGEVDQDAVDAFEKLKNFKE